MGDHGIGFRGRQIRCGEGADRSFGSLGGRRAGRKVVTLFQLNAQVRVDAVGAMDVVAEHGPQRLVQGLLDLGLEDLPVQLARDGKEQGGFHQSERMRGLDEPALAGSDSFVILQRVDHL
jgi:hypothetical protein